jgi:hypothetical protein
LKQIRHHKRLETVAWTEDLVELTAINVRLITVNRHDPPTTKKVSSLEIHLSHSYFAPIHSVQTKPCRVLFVSQVQLVPQSIGIQSEPNHSVAFAST